MDRQPVHLGNCVSVQVMVGMNGRLAILGEQTSPKGVHQRMNTRPRDPTSLISEVFVAI